MKTARTKKTSAADAPQEAAAPGQPLATPFGVDETAGLVVDLLELTGLVTADALALVR